MSTATSFILLTIVILLIISILLVITSKNNGSNAKPLTPVAGLAFAFILMGVILTDNRLIGYGFMTVGVILAIVDIIIKLRKKL